MKQSAEQSREDAFKGNPASPMTTPQPPSKSNGGESTPPKK